MSISWDAARAMHHNVREIDKHTSLFRCFTCNCWFDQQTGYQLDCNFHVIDKEVRICPIAQAMMFDC